MHHVMVHLKGFEEFLQNFIFRFLSAFNFGMFGGIVFSLNVVNIKHTIAIEVNLLKGFLRKLSSELVHGTHNHSDELIEVNISIAVDIEGLEQVVDVFLINVNLEILDTLSEFLKVQRSRVVIVHYLELSSESDQSSAASSLQLASESLDQDRLELGDLLSLLDCHLALLLG